MRVFCDTCLKTYDEDMSTSRCPHGVIESAVVAVRRDGLERLCYSKTEAEAFLSLPRSVVKATARPARGELRFYYHRGLGATERPERPIEVAHGTKLTTASGQVFYAHVSLRERLKRTWRRVWWRVLGLADRLKGMSEE